MVDDHDAYQSDWHAHVFWWHGSFAISVLAGLDQWPGWLVQRDNIYSFEIWYGPVQ